MASSYKSLCLTSRQIENDLAIRFPRQIPSSASSMTPTTAIIHVETAIPTSSSTRNDLNLIRDVPEWILTSRPMSRAHVHLINCFLLTAKEALRPLRTKIKDDLFFTPWSEIASSPRITRSRVFSRDEDLSYTEQLNDWHTSASNMEGTCGGKAAARIRDSAIDPGVMVIKSVYVRILLQMALDAVGSYYVEHDLSLLNLDGMCRQRSEQEFAPPEITQGDAKTASGNGARGGGFLRLLRRHSAT